MTTPSAALEWQDGQPVSQLYQDVYFSRDSGLDETRHVFLDHNHLQQRWQALATDSSFTIAETGFGTGLNFLCAWQLWKECAPATARLHFVSTEKYPLSLDDLAQALALWPQLAELSAQLLHQYQWLTPGWHKLIFDQGRVSLTLIIGDARDTLPRLRASVDAWFLDGFAPAKNPEMWQQDLFDSMAALSHAETTFATFTSAGNVRRGLQAAGFEVKKVSGHGRKREMLAGQFRGRSKPPVAATEKRAIVIGGGIAGTSSARALAARGWQVTLIERHAALAQEASGNPVGILYPRLAGQDIALSRLALHGYLHTLRLLQQLELPAHAYQACGLLQLAFNANETARCEAVATRGLPEILVHSVSKNEASELAGVELSHGGLYFPAAGWVNPVLLCNALATHENISIMPSATALQLKRGGEGWQVWERDNLLGQAPIVVLACANETAGFTQSAHLPLEPVRGQITFFPQTAYSAQLKSVVCTDGYLTPSMQGMHCVGATFHPNDVSQDVRQADHEANLGMLRRMAPELYQSLNTQEQFFGRVALRSATPDYLPMAGPLLDSAALAANLPRHTADPAGLPWLDGLYVNTGHGSKGLVNAPLCAEMIASAINDEPSPVDSALLAVLDPNRFLLRKLGLKRLVKGLAVYP